MASATLSQLAIIRSAPLRELLGGISDMTLRRWMAREVNPFPACHVYPGSRTKFWYLEEVKTWQASGHSSASSINSSTASETSPSASSS